MIAESIERFGLFLLVLALGAGVGGQSSAPQKPNQEGMANGKNPVPLGKLIDVGGYRVHLYCIGSGKPAVVIVGAGFSFNWGLVQPEVAKVAQVCSYDHSGIAWSDDGPKDSCSLRVGEVHNALKNAGIAGPYVLVGHSLGALVARLYAERYPSEIAGMVFVDHAYHFDPKDLKTPPCPPPPPTQTANAKPQPVAEGLESDPNFSKYSPRDRELDLWAMKQPRAQQALEANAEMMPKCFEETNATTKDNPHPLGDIPLVDVSTGSETARPRYDAFQAQLLSLSTNSKQLVAENSSHFVILDRPDVVIDAIDQVVRAIRVHSQLQASGR